LKPGVDISSVIPSSGVDITWEDDTGLLGFLFGFVDFFDEETLDSFRLNPDVEIIAEEGASHCIE
jgi:hypothetical protein